MTTFNWTAINLLVLDSERDYCDWAKSLFDEQNINECAVFREGESALDAIRGGFIPDLILIELELAMPPSPTWIRRYRNPDTIPVPNQPVVVTSANPNKTPGLMRSACLVGIESFIKKPTPDDQFLKRVQATIMRPRRFVASRTYYGPDRRQLPPMTTEYKGSERRQKIAPCPPRPIISSGEPLVIDTAPARVKPSGGKLDMGPAATKPEKSAEPLLDPLSPVPTKPVKKDGPPLETAPAEKPAAPPAKNAPIASKPVASAPTPVTGTPETKRSPATSPDKPQADKALTGKKAAIAAKLGQAKKPPADKKSSSEEDWKSALGKEEKKEKSKESNNEVSAQVQSAIKDHQIWLKTRGEKGTKATLEGMDLHGMDLHGANLSNANIRNAILSDANLANASLESADMRTIDLSSAVVSDGNLAVANMRHANLKSANFERAILRGVDLAGACLTNANLTETDFTGANLLSTDLRDADLSTAIGITQRQVAKIIANTKTKLPSGIRRPKVD